MKERKRESKHVLKFLLQCIYRGALLVRHLVVYLINQTLFIMLRIKTESSLTSFSPKENTGTRSALRKYIETVFSDLILRIDSPVLDGDLDEP